MARDSDSVESTRRAYLKYGAAVVGGGLLAGCSSGNDTESTADGSPTDVQTESRMDAATTGGAIDSDDDRW